ncbi:hypothetical protein NDU88_010674 [Pleurodeles waltl]|uniref:Uncharacterized protein n=1 Tax=Pleurodeles waltl TaxID=8319 RepID=A0AAV7QWJ7_PLEWA|nr:hypothetical protein NDU88_010674 [Pleurodeles waltl]
MGTPPGAPTPDFRVSPLKEKTDTREEEEFPIARKKTEERETPRAEEERNAPETIPETLETDSRRKQDAKGYISRHDPGGQRHARVTLRAQGKRNGENEGRDGRT